MMHFGEQFTDEEVEEMVADADTNQDGKIDYTEFSQMILREISMEDKKQHEQDMNHLKQEGWLLYLVHLTNHTSSQAKGGPEVL